MSRHMQQGSCIEFVWFYTACVCPFILYVIALACVEDGCACVRACLIGCVGQMLMMSAVMSGSWLSQEKKADSWVNWLPYFTGAGHEITHACRGQVTEQCSA